MQAAALAAARRFVRLTGGPPIDADMDEEHLTEEEMAVIAEEETIDVDLNDFRSKR